MSNVLTDWRTAVMAHLDSQLQGGSFAVRAGEHDGGSRDRKLVHVFVPSQRTDGEVNFARPQMIVRAWIPKPKVPKQQEPPDPEPVEQLMLDLAAALRPIIATAVPDGYFLVDEIEPDYEDWGVQATLTAWIRNPAHVP